MEKETMIAAGNLVKRCRLEIPIEDEYLTQGQLADYMTVSRAHIANIEVGNRPISRNLARGLADLYGMDENDFLFPDLDSVAEEYIPPVADDGSLKVQVVESDGSLAESMDTDHYVVEDGPFPRSFAMWMVSQGYYVTRTPGKIELRHWNKSFTLTPEEYRELEQEHVQFLEFQYFKLSKAARNRKRKEAQD